MSQRLAVLLRVSDRSATGFSRHRHLEMKAIQAAFADIRAAIRRRPIWVALASEDISDQHRRTTLGPFWLLINYLAFAGTFMLIFGERSSLLHFPAYIALGLYVWMFISEIVSQSVMLFVREESFIKGTTLPLSGFIMRMTLQSIIRSSYALTGCVALVLLAGVPMSIGWVWAALGMMLIIAITPAAITIMAVVGTFFPDFQFLVSNIMRIGLFLTPIFWVPEERGGVRPVLAQSNPFTYFLELIRAPVLNGDMPLYAWAVCGSIGIVLWVVALLLLGTFRKQIVHYL